MDTSLTLRLALPDDLFGVDALLGRSYPRLLGPDYPPSVMVLALPIITRARPALLRSGRYWVVLDPDGTFVGAGGWSLGAPAADGALAEQSEGVGHVRHVVTDPVQVRRGIGAAIMDMVVRTAKAEGVLRLECLSTRTAVAFYAAQGFVGTGPEVEVPLAPGIGFPAVPMQRRL